MECTWWCHRICQARRGLLRGRDTKSNDAEDSAALVLLRARPAAWSNRQFWQYAGTAASMPDMGVNLYGLLQLPESTVAKLQLVLLLLLLLQVLLLLLLLLLRLQRLLLLLLLLMLLLLLPLLFIGEIRSLILT